MLSKLVVTFCSLFTGLGVLAQKTAVEVRFRSDLYPGLDLGYVVFTPKASKPDSGFRLLVCLHGSEQSGKDLSRVRLEGIPRLCEEGREFPFLIIAPQLPELMKNKWPPALVDEFINDVIKKFPVDLNRITVTGISAGAAGAWDYACNFQNRVAGIVPVSGWGNPPIVCKMKRVPAWILHGLEDTVVNIASARSMYRALKACRGGMVTLTEISGAGHDCWRKAYSYPGVVDWLIKVHKSDPNGQMEMSGQSVSYFQLPRALFGLTGIDCLSNGELYGIIGKNSKSTVLNFDTTGRIKRIIRINNAANLSWQDLANGGNGYVYIADVGNENFKRRFFQVYKIKESDLQSEGSVSAVKIEFSTEGVKPINFRSIFYANGNLHLIGEMQNRRVAMVSIPDKEGSLFQAKHSIELDFSGVPLVASSYYDHVTKQLYLLDDNNIAKIGLPNEMLAINDESILLTNLPEGVHKDGLTRMSNGNFVFVGQGLPGSGGILYILRENRKK
jgi:hypothetical protein